MKAPENHTPLKPVDFLILLALTEEERHGYGILRDIEQTTSGEVTLDAGNLYRSIRRLMTAGLVERSERRRAADADDERRRYYRLSKQGAMVATAEARRLNVLLRLDRTQRLLEGPGS